MKRKVICFGTFDILHLGHLNYFQQARKLGNHLVVVIARDKNAEKAGKKVVFSEQERMEMVRNIKIVDEAILGSLDDPITVIIEKGPAVVCLGYDHKITEGELQERLRELNFYPQIKRMEPYKIDRYKSGRIRERSFR